MNKFNILPCISKEVSGTDKKVNVVPLSTSPEGGLMLMFPVSDANANLINFVLDEDNAEKINQNTDIVGPYKTMLASWRASGLFFSGVLLDSCFDEELGEDTMTATVILIDDDGLLSCAIKIPFTSSIILCALNGYQVYVSDELYAVLGPQIEDAKNGRLSEFSDDEDDEDDEDDDRPVKPKHNGPTNKKDDDIDNKRKEADFPADAEIEKIVKGIFEKSKPNLNLNLSGPIGD